MRLDWAQGWGKELETETETERCHLLRRRHMRSANCSSVRGCQGPGGLVLHSCDSG